MYCNTIGLFIFSKLIIPIVNLWIINYCNNCNVLFYTTALFTRYPHPPNSLHLQLTRPRWIRVLRRDCSLRRRHRNHRGQHAIGRWKMEKSGSNSKIPGKCVLGPASGTQICWDRYVYWDTESVYWDTDMLRQSVENSEEDLTIEPALKTASPGWGHSLGVDVLSQVDASYVLLRPTDCSTTVVSSAIVAN